MWQGSYWDRHSRRDQDVLGLAMCLLSNPVRRGLCEDIYQWPWSWSAWHSETRGPSPEA